MKIRKRALPEGWYPNSKHEIESLIAGWVSPAVSGDIEAGVLPHAGWTFCGSIIAQIVGRVAEAVDTIVVLGGHNPPGGTFIAYPYDEWSTPIGSFAADWELADSVKSLNTERWADEEFADNTIEVIMVMALALRPGAKWAAWRVPADRRAIGFGESLAKAAEISGRRIAVLGSTDLTHYGPQYGFAPPESRDDPVRWVRERDWRMLEALADFDGEGALKAANIDKCACSAGGAVAAMSYAKARGTGKGRVLSYGTSRDIYPADSFVGYGGLVWE